MLHNSVQAKTVAELVALSKRQQITLGTSGVGSASHLTLARFNAATGANIVHVPYRGGGALIPDVLAGTVSGAMTEVSTLLEHHNQGKVRILAVAWSKRPAKTPDVPTMIEQGVKDFTAASYVGVLAPAKTPPEIVAMLEKALVKALADKGTQDKFLASGAELVPAELQTSKGFARLHQEGVRELQGGGQDRGAQAGVTERRYFCSIPAFSRTALHLACSAAMNCANCCRRRALHHRADLAQALADRGLLEHLVERLVELGDDRRRHALGSEQAIPGVDVVARHDAGLDRRRHVRRGREAVLAGHRQRANLAGLDLAEQRRHRIEQHVHVLGEQRREHLRRGAVVHLQQFDAGRSA